MKVTILTEGGRDIGYGHITRCTSIYEAFEEIGKQSQLIVNGDETIEDLLKGKNYKVFNWLDDQQLLFEILDNANIVFIDSYLAKHDIYERISEQVKTAVYFDDDLRIDYPRGFVLNGAIFAEQLPYPKKDDVTNLLGTMYTPIRREFWDTPPKLIRKEVETLMVTFGGSDMCNVTPKVQKVLNETYPYLQKRIIVTRLFANMSEIKKLQDKNTELIYEPDAAELKEVMFESDIAISAGGQTLYELARIGVPTIAVSTADNQLYNIRGWEKAKFIEYAGSWENRNVLKNIKTSVNKLKDPDLRKNIFYIGRKYVDGKGAARTAESVNAKPFI